MKKTGENIGADINRQDRIRTKDERIGHHPKWQFSNELRKNGFIVKSYVENSEMLQLHQTYNIIPWLKR